MFVIYYNNKETTFDLGSSLAQRLSFLLFQFCSWINLDVERGPGYPTCPSDLLEEGGVPNTHPAHHSG